MFGLRFSEGHPRAFEERPPAQKTTGVANARPIQFMSAPRDISRVPPVAMSAIVGDEYRHRSSAAATQNRRVMSTSSGLGPVSSVMSVGSRAMPQIGQAPGPSRTISGCMGQVYWTAWPSRTAGAGC